MSEGARPHRFHGSVDLPNQARRTSAEAERDLPNQARRTSSEAERDLPNQARRTRAEAERVGKAARLLQIWGRRLL